LHDLNLAIIGNCQIAAMLDGKGQICWSCWPRFDGDPVFCSLMRNDSTGSESGLFDIELLGCESTEQHYRPNTAIVNTILHDEHGGAVRITDFAPRFRLYNRMYRPTMIVRRIEPLAGSPQVRIRLRPSFDYGARSPELTHGSHHIRYVGDDQVLRLTTDLAITAIIEEVPFLLEEPATLILGPDEPLDEAPATASRTFYEETCNYWRDWVRGLSVPFEWQEAVLRAAIILKLCTFEDTGAVVAALTTSIPEAPDSGRNWDYRYCWLRDSYFVVHALNRLGATKTMEAYLRYTVNIVAQAGENTFQPVYGISGASRIIERQVSSLSGYRGMGPVHVGNEAYKQRQNDVYGAVVLAATQMFFDTRLAKQGDRALFERLEQLGERAVAVFDRPDAGIWEYRGRERVHTYSSVMCWAACDRLARIAARLGIAKRERAWRKHADAIRKEILHHSWNPKSQRLVASFGGNSLDASLLLLPELRFLPADDERFRHTMAAVESELRRGKFLLRYGDADDFGMPETAFTICTFWYIDALAAVGRHAEARELFEEMLACRTSLGLLSEDIHPDTHELWGNFPQTYSMVGIINTAMRLSKSWEEAL